MDTYPKPRVVISRCIEFDSCRWNGLRISSDAVKLLKPLVEFFPVCPEMEIGLGMPREPVRIVAGKKMLALVQPETGRDLTDAMRQFSLSFLDPLTGIDAFILKERSPSCGVKSVKVYPAAGKAGPLHSRGTGVFAQAVLERFPETPLEDEGRLNNYDIREHFLTRIFTLARFRETRKSNSMRALVEFHTKHKFLLMAYSQKELKELGAIVANRGGAAADELFLSYERHLKASLTRPPQPGQSINVLMHAFGYVSQSISPREKTFFLDALRNYRARRLPLGVPVAVMRSLIARFDERYLSAQCFFAPYPEELVQVSDSGKGRELRR